MNDDMTDIINDLLSFYYYEIKLDEEGFDDYIRGLM